MKKLKLEELNRISIEEFKNIDKIPVVVLMDNIRSMHNVGSIFRSSDAFKIHKIYLAGITPIPPHREIQKTALGATESVNWEHNSSIELIINQLKSENYKIIGIEQTSNSQKLNEYSIQKDTKYALILGNEVEGISDSILPLIDDFIEIPQAGTKHSLNVSVCAGIVLWEFYQKLEF